VLRPVPGNSARTTGVRSCRNFLYFSIPREDQERYLPATADQILEAARYVIDQNATRGTLFASPELVKD
jgi:hypothetical protein